MPVNSLTAATQITIGHTQSGVNNSLNGYINEVLVYNSVISETNLRLLERNQGWYYNIAPDSASVSKPLDTVGSASAAYGLRQLRTAYNSSLIRVRRSSDNAEQDIGILNGELDVPSLLGFAGTNSAYVKTWYDQSGNALHQTQTTTGAQPRIVNAGILETISGKPAIHFLGSQYLSASDASLPSGASARTLIGSYQFDDAIVGADNTSNGLFGWGTNASQKESSLCRFRLDTVGTSDPYFRGYGSASDLASGGVGFAYDTDFKVSTLQYDGTNVSTYKNGVAGNTAAKAVSTLLSGSFTIGKRPFGSNMTGLIAEVYIYPSNLSSTNRSTVQQNILQYYAPPLPIAYITKWYDQSGNGYDASQQSPTLQPTLILSRYGSLGNQPTVYFNGGQQLITAGGMPISADYSKSAVFSYYSNTGYNNIISSNGGHAIYNAGTNYLRMWHTADFAISNTASTMKTPYAISTTFTQATMTGNLYQGNQLVGSGTSPSSATNAEVYLGAWANQSYLSGTISEALVFNRVLTSTERTVLYRDQSLYYGAL